MIAAGYLSRADLGKEKLAWPSHGADAKSAARSARRAATAASGKHAARAGGRFVLATDPRARAGTSDVPGARRQRPNLVVAFWHARTHAQLGRRFGLGLAANRLAVIRARVAA
jgi:hypothetical protein